ncbi:MAG: hypothetical protein RLZZ546_3398 [Bacteroidota bacterium]|jgi:hypothetical protein
MKITSIDTHTNALFFNLKADTTMGNYFIINYDKMRLLFLMFIAMCATAQLTAQNQKPEEIIKEFFVYMKNADTMSLNKILVKNTGLHSVILDKQGNTQILYETMKNFKKSIADLMKGDADERIYNIKVEQRDLIASVTADYDLYYKGKFLHCGVDVFGLLKENNQWKITSIHDTRKNNCNSQNLLIKANKFLDEWHMDASKADSAAYFSKMDDHSIFVGTDSSEVWSKAAFSKFAGPYFAKGKAWDFKKTSRNLHIEMDKNMIWFDEMLNTWMGPCRGSGWIELKEDKMYIKQYILSVTVPNEKIQKFIEALK